MSAKYNLNLPTLMCPRQQFGLEGTAGLRFSDVNDVNIKPVKDAYLSLKDLIIREEHVMDDLESNLLMEFRSR